MADDTKQLYIKRINICRACPHIVKKLTGRYCEVCGCKLEAKCRIKGDSCPLGKW